MWSVCARLEPSRLEPHFGASHSISGPALPPLLPLRPSRGAGGRGAIGWQSEGRGAGGAHHRKEGNQSEGPAVHGGDKDKGKKRKGRTFIIIEGKGDSAHSRLGDTSRTRQNKNTGPPASGGPTCSASRGTVCFKERREAHKLVLGTLALVRAAWPAGSPLPPSPPPGSRPLSPPDLTLRMATAAGTQRRGR